MRREFRSQSHRDPSFILECEGNQPAERERVNAAVSKAGGEVVLKISPHPEGKYHLIVSTPNGGGASVDYPEKSGCPEGVHEFMCIPYGGHVHQVFLVPHGLQVRVSTWGYKGRGKISQLFLDGIYTPIREFKPL